MGVVFGQRAVSGVTQPWGTLWHGLSSSVAIQSPLYGGGPIANIDPGRRLPTTVGVAGLRSAANVRTPAGRWWPPATLSGPNPQLPLTADATARCVSRMLRRP
jgi:hypothetical protein